MVKVMYQKQAHGCPGQVLPQPCPWQMEGSPPGLLGPPLGVVQGGGSVELPDRVGGIGLQ